MLKSIIKQAKKYWLKALEWEFKLEDSKITKIPSRAETDQYSQLWMRSNLCRLHLTCRMRKIPMIMDMFAERAVSIGCWFNKEPWKRLLWYRKPCK